jgi:3'-phosphoadenosine 5'-phosphosulfate (PAPS) 3'-phosphatase
MQRYFISANEIIKADKMEKKKTSMEGQNKIVENESVLSSGLSFCAVFEGQLNSPRLTPKD